MMHRISSFTNYLFYLADTSQSRDDLPSIYNPATSIAEVLMSNISTWCFKQWLSSDASGRAHSDTSSLSPKIQMPEPPPISAPNLHYPMQPIRPQPMRLAAPSMPLPGHHAAMQQQLNQIKVNQCLSAARNALSNMGPMANPISPLAVQMAMAQQLGGNPFLGQYQMPFPVAPNHQLMMQHFASLQQPPLSPNNHPMANLYVKRMNEETAVKDESSPPPVKRRRSRKSTQVNRVPTAEPQKISPKIAARPDQFVMQEGQGRGPIIFRGISTSGAVVTSHQQQMPVIQPYHQQQLQFNHQINSAPVYFPPVATVASQPVGSPAPSSASSSGASQPPVSTSPLAQALSPSSQAVFTNGVRVTVTPTVENSNQTPAVASQNSSSASPTGQPKRISPSKVKSSPDHGSMKTPPKDEQQLKVPPLKIRLSDINQSPDGKKFTPPRAGLPEIVQKSNSYAKVDRVQQQITAYRAEETDTKEEFSLKNLLDNSPPATKVPESSVVSKFDDNLYYNNDCSVST
jgi:hypothetical protein